MEFCISKQWDGDDIAHSPITLRLQPTTEEADVKLSVQAPFFDDPPKPSGSAGVPFPQLWDYEVVEAFFLAADDNYLEVELCPHGQHLVLLLNGCRKCFKDQLPLQYSATITGDQWYGEARIPAKYFPANVCLFNAYAIHGSGSERLYEALYPAPKGKYAQPDFHRLEYFQPLNFSKVLPSNALHTHTSELWSC